jgi:hypothetical protein
LVVPFIANLNPWPLLTYILAIPLLFSQLGPKLLDIILVKFLLFLKHLKFILIKLFVILLFILFLQVFFFVYFILRKLFLLNYFIELLLVYVINALWVEGSTLQPLKQLLLN